jgi:hypothetical protein
VIWISEPIVKLSELIGREIPFADLREPLRGLALDIVSGVRLRWRWAITHCVSSRSLGLSQNASAAAQRWL